MRLRLLLIGPEPPARVFGAAEAHHRRGEFAPAQKLLRDLHERDPTHIPSLVLLGDIAQRDGRNAAAHDGIAMAYQAGTA